MVPVPASRQAGPARSDGAGGRGQASALRSDRGSRTGTSPPVVVTPLAGSWSGSIARNAHSTCSSSLSTAVTAHALRRQVLASERRVGGERPHHAPIR